MRNLFPKRQPSALSRADFEISILQCYKITSGLILMYSLCQSGVKQNATFQIFPHGIIEVSKNITIYLYL